MIERYDYRERVANPFNPGLSDGTEPRYAGPAREGAGKGGVIAVVVLLLGIAAGMYFVSPADDDAAVPNRSAVTDQQRPSGAAGS